MRRFILNLSAAVVALAGMASMADGAPRIIAVARIDSSVGDKATQTAAALENGVAGNLLGGIGSGLSWAGGSRFYALPDRGPNAVKYNAASDNTSSYIPRVQVLDMALAPAAGGTLPFTVTPQVSDTVLLSSATRLVYSDGAGVGLKPGIQTLNSAGRFYFSGRSDNFDAGKGSDNTANGRFDPESLRFVGGQLYISDEYGPDLYRFDATTGVRTAVISLPAKLYVAHPAPVGDDEDKANNLGRSANKGMEGLALTPDGKTLVGIMQSPLLQDGGTKAGYVRIIAIDVASGATREYAYGLDQVGTPDAPKFAGISEIVAINSHEFLVDERDGKGLGDGSSAKVKRLYRIDLNGAAEVSELSGEAALKDKAVAKTLFLDVVAAAGAAGIAPDQVPAKIEGMTFGPDVTVDGQTLHTLWLASDNDFKADPNMVFVVGVSDADLPGQGH